MRIGTWIALATAFLASAATAEDMCAAPEQSCGRLLSPACLGRLGAGSQGVEASGQPVIDCDSQFATYRECLATVATSCGGKNAPSDRSACPPETENRLWDAVKDSDDLQDLALFVETCPDSPFAQLAARRITALSRAASPAPTPPANATINLPATATPEIAPPLVKAPQPSNRPTSIGGFRLSDPSSSGKLRAGSYIGKSTNHTVGGTGDTTLTVIKIDPATSVAEARLAWSNGLFGQGPLRGRLLADGWLILSGPIDSGVTGRWTIEVKVQPPDADGAVFGDYYLTPLAGNLNGYQTGRFELRRAN
ncbi:MAG: hypothetical protein KTR21_18370 [Rhodobacteraceae bacterium]|nr:hypothetical protein [Paracoccaceae bacterium]